MKLEVKRSFLEKIKLMGIFVSFLLIPSIFSIVYFSINKNKDESYIISLAIFSILNILSYLAFLTDMLLERDSSILSISFILSVGMGMTAIIASSIVVANIFFKIPTDWSDHITYPSLIAGMIISLLGALMTRKIKVIP